MAAFKPYQVSLVKIAIKKHISSRTNEVVKYLLLFPRLKWFWEKKKFTGAIQCQIFGIKSAACVAGSDRGWKPVPSAATPVADWVIKHLGLDCFLKQRNSDWSSEPSPIWGVERLAVWAEDNLSKNAHSSQQLMLKVKGLQEVMICNGTCPENQVVNWWSTVLLKCSEVWCAALLAQTVSDQMLCAEKEKII